MIGSRYPVTCRYLTFLPVAAALTSLGGVASAAKPSKRPYVSARAYYQAMRGELFRASGDLAGARKALRVALVYDTDSAWLNLNYATVLHELADPGAERALESAIRLAPRSPRVRYLEGLVRSRQGDVGRARRAFERVIRRAPKSRLAVRAAIDRAAMLDEAGDLDAAVEGLAEFARRRPEPPILEGWAKLLVKRGDLAGASLVWSRRPDLFAQPLTEAWSRLEAAEEAN